MSRRWIGQYQGESLINVKADVDEAMAMLENLNGNRKSMRRRILSGIGTSVKQAVKKNYTSLLKKQSRTLYKSVTAKIFKSGAAVKISPRAQRSNILYGYALAKGSTIRATNSEFLTFKIGDKWIRKQQVTLKPVDWIESPAKRYLSSSSYRQRLDQLVQKEIDRAEKAAQRKAANAK
ncbi:MAG: hypothetical protein ILP16_12465 [Spirochaetales bacterium]|nr:hypothetical protein [Spirochaetales bacterium]